VIHIDIHEVIAYRSSQSAQLFLQLLHRVFIVIQEHRVCNVVRCRAQDADEAQEYHTSCNSEIESFLLNAKVSKPLKVYDQ